MVMFAPVKRATMALRKPAFRKMISALMKSKKFISFKNMYLF